MRTVASSPAKLLRNTQVGTYDSLSDMIITALPSPGASGGPVVDEAGCVVGIVRGWRSAYDERTTSGFASPAQALWEVADLPGLRSRA